MSDLCRRPACGDAVQAHDRATDFRDDACSQCWCPGFLPDRRPTVQALVALAVLGALFVALLAALYRA